MLSNILKSLIESDPSLLKDDGSINQYAAARAFGVNQPTLSRVLSGESREPKGRFVDAVCTYFSIEPAQLRGEKPLQGLSGGDGNVPPRITRNEELLLSLFRALPPATQKVAIRVVAALNE